MENDKISSIEIEGIQHFIIDADTSELLHDTILTINKNTSAISTRINDINERLSNLEESDILKLLKKIFSEGNVGQLLSKTENGYEWKDISFASDKSQLMLSQPTATVYKTGKTVIEWNEVENADSYIVNTNKKEITDKNSHEVNNFDGDIFVKAVCVNNDIYDSDYVLANKIYDDTEPNYIYNLYDILWSDGEVTQEVRPVSDGVIPVALCVIPTNWIDEGEKARFVSLKYVSSNKNNGSLNIDSLSWGSYNASPDPVEPYYLDKACKSMRNDQDTSTAYYYWNSTNYDEIPDLRDHDSWMKVYSEHLEHIVDYAITDIDGKTNTVNINVDGNIESSRDLKRYLPNFMISGVDSTEWYLPAAGELIHFTFNINFELNNIIKEINKVYPNDCVQSFANTKYWTSTVNNKYNAYCSEISTEYVNIIPYRRDYGNAVVAFLQK